MQRLSSAAVRHAKEGWHADGSGLYLQVSPCKVGDHLNKSWVVTYTRQSGLNPNPLSVMA